MSWGRRWNSPTFHFQSHGYFNMFKLLFSNICCYMQIRCMHLETIQLVVIDKIALKTHY